MIATPQGTAGKKDGRSREEGRQRGREADRNEWEGVEERGGGGKLVDEEKIGKEGKWG